MPLIRSLAAFLAFTPLGATAQAPAPVTVPHASAAITIDGRFDDGEWTAATRIEHPAGTVVHLQRDGEYLYLGVTSERAGFASLCVAHPETIDVIHASAALDALTYRASNGTWRTADTAFTWAMRNTALDEGARRERAAYLAQHGWVASSIPMGEGRTQEIQLSLARYPLPMRIALARWLTDDNRIEHWPATLGANDGCAVERLVQGWVVAVVGFEPEGWVVLHGR